MTFLLSCQPGFAKAIGWRTTGPVTRPLPLTGDAGDAHLDQIRAVLGAMLAARSNAEHHSLRQRLQRHSNAGIARGWPA